jgi:hypothetical protein
MIIRTVCFIFKKKQLQRSYNYIIFQHSPLALQKAFRPSPHNLLYDLRIESFGLTDRYIQLLVRGIPTASYGLFKWIKQVSLKV